VLPPPADPVLVVAEDRDIVEVPLLRGPVRPLQGAAAERFILDFKINVDQQRRPAPQKYRFTALS
jgi:hypothetical protein